MSGKLARMKESGKRRFPRLAAAARYVTMRKKRFIALFVVFAHVVGALTSVQAIMRTRTSQGAIAWVVALNTAPYYAVPAYWVFGRSKFDGYVDKRRGGDEKASPIIEGFVAKSNEEGLTVPGFGEGNHLIERLVKLPATGGNEVELLVNGEEIFPSIWDGIDAAESYVLVQFFIVRNDGIGKELKKRLLAARERGVKVYFVYDEVGSLTLDPGYVSELRDAGAEVLPFNTMKGITNRFQINFRNHRKTVIADGRVAWVGGMNIGDEYMHGDGKLTPWRETAVKVTGPAVQTIQVPFWEDWLWASDTLLELEWDPEPSPSGADLTVMCVPSGPADRFDTCALYFLHLVNSATERLWVASPYFIPDEQLVSALQLAALRGVDVRVLVPDVADGALVNLSGWSFIERMEEAGVKVHRHTNGFTHQKVMLVDSDLATVGTANFDNRSFRLNFELTLGIRDEAFAAEVATMLEKDFADSRLATVDELMEKGFLYRLAVRASSLLAPIQ